eukprot:TRINITY_DN15754_c0_g1_i2.p1 TRINITY_DN15754_c0_g1~~TRINITY_DN15754_c0_g1_i2.p1  ORF type:complete len:213 (+),score=2.64 TRINITY_DN15754_c0_g1_i2:78-716(+)
MSDQLLVEIDQKHDSKSIFLFRHAESLYNEHVHSWASILTCRCCCDPNLPDPVLSSTGWEQARSRGESLQRSNFLETNQIQLIVVSPLSRAIQTCLSLFPPSTHRVPILVCDIHREIMETSSDVGRSPQELVQDFPELKFDHIPQNWWFVEGQSGPVRESKAHYNERIREFRKWLLARPESRIVVVGHSHFFAVMTNRPKLANCAMMQIQLP